MKTICMFCEPENKGEGSHGFCNVACMHKGQYLITRFDKDNDKDQIPLHDMLQEYWEDHVKPYLLQQRIIRGVEK